MQTYTVKEYESKDIPRNLISDETIKKLEGDYKSKISIELKSSENSDQWRFTAQGWVGYIQITSDIRLFIEPKASIKNVLAMLEYDPKFKGFQFPLDLVGCQTLQDFLNHLANLLSDRVLERCRKGLYCAYINRNDSLTHVRGRIDISKNLRKPWEIKMNCQYQENTRDIEDNQIIAYTLHRILRSGLCNDKSQSKIHKAFQGLQSYVTLRPFVASDCLNRQYSRLNQDYRTLHILCQFLLSHTAPSHAQGNSSSFGFLVDMAKLYETFVTAWLQKNLSPHLKLYKQYSIQIGLNCRIDLVIANLQTDECQFVLDTKYKVATTPKSEDLHQIRSYAEAMKCRNAILIYPQPLSLPLDTHNLPIRTRSLTFALNDDLDKCGKKFLEELDV